MDKSQIGLAGEFYVLAQLTQRGFVATLTLGNTKGVDILVTNQEIDKLYKVEVKTTSSSLKNDRLFGEEKFHMWQLSEKNEKIKDKNLVYCFVVLHESSVLPDFFLVPATEVAKYVEWQHGYWLSTRTKEVKSTTMRKFRIEESDQKKYKNNWGIFTE